MGSIMSRNLVWGLAEPSALRVRDTLLPVILTGWPGPKWNGTGRGCIFQTSGQKAKKRRPEPGERSEATETRWSCVLAGWPR